MWPGRVRPVVWDSRRCALPARRPSGIGAPCAHRPSVRAGYSPARPPTATPEPLRPSSLRLGPADRSRLLHGRQPADVPEELLKRWEEGVGAPSSTCCACGGNWRSSPLCSHPRAHPPGAAVGTDRVARRTAAHTRPADRRMQPGGAQHSARQTPNRLPTDAACARPGRRQPGETINPAALGPRRRRPGHGPRLGYLGAHLPTPCLRLLRTLGATSRFQLGYLAHGMGCLHPTARMPVRTHDPLWQHDPARSAARRSRM